MVKELGVEQAVMFVLGHRTALLLSRAAAVQCAATAGAKAYLEGGLERTLGGACGFRSGSAAMAPIKVTAAPVRPDPRPLPIYLSKALRAA